MTRAVIRERAAELLEFVQFTDRAEGGRAAVRRHEAAADHRPGADQQSGILMLDEPTTGLDPQARHVVWDRLFRLKQQGTTLMLTTHYMDEAEQLCDRLVVMDKGRIAAEGSPRELIERYATREVLELRFQLGEQEQAAEKLAGMGERLEPLAGPGTGATRTTARPR